MSEKPSAIQIKQGDRTLLLFSLPAKDLLSICYFNSREIDRVEGIQRELNKARSRQIADFVDGPEPCLANNIIINIELEALGLKLRDVYSKGDGTLDLKKIQDAAENPSKERPKMMQGKCAFVIDGQHRLRAFELAENKELPLVVTALIDLSLAEVAELFVQINFNQKPVNKSLVFDLLGLSPEMFPGYKDLHDVVTRLNDDIESPFYRRIKMLGVGEGTISQATVITAIENYRIRETMRGIIGKDVSGNSLYDVFWNYFTGVAGAFQESWEEKGRLCRTISVRAFVIVMGEMLKKYHEKGKAFGVSNIKSDLRKIPIEDILNRTKGFGGEKGVKEMSQLILSEMGYSV